MLFSVPYFWLAVGKPVHLLLALLPVSLYCLLNRDILSDIVRSMLLWGNYICVCIEKEKLRCWDTVVGAKRRRGDAGAAMLLG